MEAILKKEVVVNKALCRVFAVLSFVILTSLGAFVRIPLPFTPVPITLQTLFVLLSGALLGSGLGATVQLSYIALGLLGLPIFTGAGSGVFYLFGPTGGYLFGFVLAAWFAARFINYAKNNLLLIFGLLFLADIFLLSCGIIWLRIIYRYPLPKLLYIGFIPFIPADLIKAFIAAILYLNLKPRLKAVL